MAMATRQGQAGLDAKTLWKGRGGMGRKLVGQAVRDLDVVSAGSQFTLPDYSSRWSELGSSAPLGSVDWPVEAAGDSKTLCEGR